VSARSIDELVYAALRDEIIRGLAPGTPLRLRDLADRFSTSTMPVRTALSQLQNEGLVLQEQRRGATVAPLSLEDFEEIQLIRSGLEGVAARAGLATITDNELREMSRIYEELAALDSSSGQFLEDHMRLNRALHDVVYQASQRQKLLDLIDKHRRSAERYLRFALMDSMDFAGNLDLQRKFLQQCLERNGSGAEQSVRDLLSWTVAKLSPTLQAPSARTI
jgi:DNA-binding GntR family transcriptional regulator